MKKKLKLLWTGLVAGLMSVVFAFSLSGCTETKLIGFDTEMAESFAAAEGLDIKFRLIKWESKEMELASGRSDLVWNGLTVTKERAQNMQLSNNYMTNKQVAVIRKDTLEQFGSEEKIIASKAKVAAETESAGAEAMEKLPATCKKKLIDSQRSAMLDVKTKNSDVAIVDMTMAEYLCNIDGVFSTLMVVPDYDPSGVDENGEPIVEHYAVAAKKGNTGLIAKVNDFLETCFATGEMKEIATTYGLSELLEKSYVNSVKYDLLTDSQKADFEAVKKKGKIVVAYTLNAPIAMRQDA